MKPSFDASPPKETLVGSVERVTFHNDDNGFAVLKVKARGKRDLVPVVGHVASISTGEYIHAVGAWILARHGRAISGHREVLTNWPSRDKTMNWRVCRGLDRRRCAR